MTMQNDHEWSLCFERWNDADYLWDFFTTHKKDLDRDFWNGISIEDAIEKTRLDAKRLERKLLELAKEGKQSDGKTLSNYFKPLKKGSFDPNYEKDKAYGVIKPSWLRIYAIRVDINFFVVSGSGIKLTETMNNRKHLRDELKKLDLTKNYLQDHPNDPIEGFELY